MNPKRFLFGAGIFLIIFGFLGLIGVLGDISLLAFFRPPYWINWVHFLLGITVFIISLTPYKKLQTITVLFPAIIATTIGIAGLLFGRYAAVRFNIPDLADPSDHTAHLIVGGLAIWAFKNRNRF